MREQGLKDVICKWKKEGERGPGIYNYVQQKSYSPWAGGKVGINLVAKVEWYHFVPYINTKQKICDSLAIGVAFRFYE